MYALVSLIQLIETIHKICKVRDSNPTNKKIQIYVQEWNIFIASTVCYLFCCGKLFSLIQSFYIHCNWNISFFENKQRHGG